MSDLERQSHSHHRRDLGHRRGVTELFARSGAKVVTMSIQAAGGKALAERLTGEGHQCVFQLRRREQGGRRQGGRRPGRGRSSAGSTPSSPTPACCGTRRITDITVDDFHTIINVNLLGVVLICKHAIRVMERQRKGVICITTSVASQIGFPEHAVYGASKAALVALMRSLTTDHSPNGVRFVGVSPGTIDTPMLAASCEGWDKPKEELYAEVAKKIPIQRMGQPIDVARAVAFLLSDEAGVHQRKRGPPGGRHAGPAAVVEPHRA